MDLPIPLSPFSQRPFAATSLLGHLPRQTADVPIFPVRGGDPIPPAIRVFRHLTDGSVILSFFLVHFAGGKKEDNHKKYLRRYVDRCISKALASGIRMSLLSFGGRRDSESSHTKGQDLKPDGNGHKHQIIPPCQIQLCHLRCMPRVYYGYKCTIKVMWDRSVHEQRVKIHQTRQSNSCRHLNNMTMKQPNPNRYLFWWPAHVPSHPFRR